MDGVVALMHDHDSADRIMNLLTYAALLSEQGVPETPERMSEINKTVREVAHEVRKLPRTARSLEKWFRCTVCGEVRTTIREFTGVCIWCEEKGLKAAHEYQKERRRDDANT